MHLKWDSTQFVMMLFTIVYGIVLLSTFLLDLLKPLFIQIVLTVYFKQKHPTDLSYGTRLPGPTGCIPSDSGNDVSLGYSDGWAIELLMLTLFLCVR